MSYRTELADKTFNWKYADGLVDHLANPVLDDLKIKYDLPFIQDRRTTPRAKKSFPLKEGKMRFPARLSNALIPYPDTIKEAISSNTRITGNTLHGHHTRDVNRILDLKSEVQKTFGISSTEDRYDIPSLKSLVKCQFSSKTDLINLSALEFARRATSHDLSIAAMSNINYQPNTRMASPYLSFLIAMQRMRTLLCTKGQSEKCKYVIPHEPSEDGTVQILEDTSYIHVQHNSSQKHVIIVSGGHFAMYHSDKNYWFYGPFSYLDYALTLADTINNLELLSYDKSYEWARDFFILLIKLAESEGDHNIIVNFMKSFEGFILNMSDYDENHAMNWVPIMDCLHELWISDQVFSKKSYPFNYLPALLHDPEIYHPSESYLCKFIVALKKMDRTQMQEISALHKFVFYAEVDAGAGVDKFLKRVHTPRPVDIRANKSITQLAKLEFVISYCHKHKSLPTLKAPPKKLTVLKIYFNQNDMTKLRTYPLSWWNDVTPWACMDSTLTDDALEFAKDKGALKKKFKCGPGDSRKELLQLIETPDYKLRDLMADGKFRRQVPEVYITNQSENDIPHKHPARLIEKEREQKIEARLFANGELSNKHALSVMTTKMKKVLAYFSEQLMTPSDSKRKMLLHRASQMLREDKNFSVLLDIEGHNQSMQETNTSELLEFIGNVFGETGWGSLANYFGALFVYHYDEYEDKVIVSKGQLGGIEGWMNPVWTMHTLLMMKLLRINTDLVIPELMVYSDDVNAIITLLQPTEATLQSVFSKIMKHCLKFGMVAKFSQTTLSKHRATMLRQHYAKGLRADSTLKRLMAVSGANNGMIVSEELEVAGICSSAASALEFSNHSETCCYLKNYKIGILLARLPQMILSRPQEQGMLSEKYLPEKLVEILYHVKDDRDLFQTEMLDDTVRAVKNDVAKYLHMTGREITQSTMMIGLEEFFGYTLAKTRLVDGPDRMLYLQIYDSFIQDLLFFWTYMPTSVGGLGAITHIDMILSGHSNGFSKAIHYIHQWAAKYSGSPQYFLNYIEASLTNSNEPHNDENEWRILTAKWPSESKITSASTSLSSSIKSMVHQKTVNTNVLALFKMAETTTIVGREIVKIFKNNYHSRIAQFYYENSSVHFLDLLINKIETSSGLLSEVHHLARLRFNLVRRTIGNIRIASSFRTSRYGKITASVDMIDYLMRRRAYDFPNIKFIQAEEILYDNKLSPTYERDFMVEVRKCSPLHFKDGHQVYNDPRIGDEVTYKGDYLDRERMIGNKEELLAARVVSVTKWLLTKTNNLGRSIDLIERYDCAQACDLVLQTLTGQKMVDLMPYCPDETGGEILHRIPNMRFTSNTYIRSEMNMGLSFVAELSQKTINKHGLVDSNINFDYVRMRLICASIVRAKFDTEKGVISRYKLTNTVGVCDVQFVSPQPLDWKSNLRLEAYSSFRGHKFSNLRFRFLATSYLSIEDLNDLSLFPMQADPINIQAFGTTLKREIVYKYARAMDKEYMSISLAHPRAEVWQQVYHKLGVLDPEFSRLSDDEKFDESTRLLQAELVDRNHTKVIRSHDKTESLLQSDCINRILFDRPDDQIYQTLLSTYMIAVRQNTSKESVQKRINHFNHLLMTQDAHRAALCDSVIYEIIVTLHFHTLLEDGVLSLDVSKSLQQFEEVGVMIKYLEAVNPELYARTRILGPRVVFERYQDSKHIIREYLYDLSLTTASSDVSLPALSLSVRSNSVLTEEVHVPIAADSVIYMGEEIGRAAMLSLGDIKGICNYAENCCDYGANPAVLESPTGSDTFCAQYGFFRYLMDAFGLDESTSICDLTAGRGDGKYAATCLGLNTDSYSLLDNFTASMHHPDLIFTTTYDITKSDTLNFITNYDFVHIDVSFLRDGKTEVGDLLLYLESVLLPYSIRLNSISLDVYANSMGKLENEYSHTLAYCVSDQWRTPQVYLIGTPGQPHKQHDGISLRHTVAFRAMALSFTELMRQPYQDQVLPEPQLNSISVCLPDNSRLGTYIKYIANNVISDERRYYVKRFSLEFSSDATIYLAESRMQASISKIMESSKLEVVHVEDAVYTHYSIDDIGMVSQSSLPFHKRHVEYLHCHGSEKSQIILKPKHKDLMSALRIHHPLRSIRGLCNVLLGILKLCPNITEFTREAVEREMTIDEGKYYLKLSRHQEEMVTAMKLLILAIRYDQPTLGLIYCSLMSQNNPSKSSYMRRVRKRYKLISGHSNFIRNQLQAGNLERDTISAMADELFSKRPHQYKQGRKYNRTITTEDNNFGDAFLENLNFEKLFDGLEKSALAQQDDLITWPSSTDDVMDVMEGEVNEFNASIDDESVKFNINMDLGKVVDDWALSNNMILDPLTNRYVGFDDCDMDDGDEEW